MPQEAREAGAPALERILAVATKRFGDFGYRRTSIADIARDAGLAVGTVYRYFPGKEELFLGTLRRLNDAWESEARRALAGPGNAMVRLRRLGAASVRFGGEHPLLASLLTRDTEIIFAPLLDQMYDEHVERLVGMMTDVVRQGVAEGTFRAVDAERAAYVLFLAGHALSQQRRYPYAEMMSVFEEIIYQGLLRRRGGKRT
jgi:AcrR family transcriptional regulator